MIDAQPDSLAAAQAATLQKIARHQIASLNPETSDLVVVADAARTTGSAAVSPPTSDTTMARRGGTAPPAAVATLPALTAAARTPENEKAAAIARKQTPSGARGPKREPWLMQQASGSYTIQLLSTRNESALQHFTRDHRLEQQTAYYGKIVNGQQWYSLVFGLYDSAASAHAAINRLPAALLDNEPWVIPLNRVQRAIRQSSGNRHPE